MYPNEGIDKGTVLLTVLSCGSLHLGRTACGCHCTYNGTCHTTDVGGVHIRRAKETGWHGAYLCEVHARELNLLW